MSDTFGALYIQGIQNSLPGGGIQGIGPFAIPASGVQDTNTWVVDTSVTIPVPTTAGGFAYDAQGVFLVPPTGGTVAWRFKTVSADTGTYLNPALPTFIDFDQNNMPTYVYLTSASSVAIIAQFI